jgi:nicotinate-nucleotide adenylyltransferase
MTDVTNDVTGGASATTVAIFGGSFNPPHIAHQFAALWVLETQPVDELWLVPTFAHALGKPLAPFAHRVAMCELAAGALGARVRVCLAEAELARAPSFVASRSLDLIEHLERAHPGTRLRLAIGADILAETHQWHRWDEVARRAPPIVIARPGYVGGAGAGMPMISSTHIRSLLVRETASPAATEELTALVPACVLRYIAAHTLYK